MKDSLLRKYIKSVIVNEAMYIRSSSDEVPSEKKSGRGWLDKIKSFFAGTSDVDDLASSWLEEQELYYDIDFPEETRNEVLEFARFKFPRILDRARGNKEKAAMLVRKALAVKFAPEIRDIEREIRRRQELEDEEVYK